MGSKRKFFWSVVRTKFGEEITALKNIRAQQFEPYHPRYRDRLRNGVREIKPLFPGYMFVRIGRDQAWDPLRSTRGVHSLFYSGDAPAPVLDSDVRAIRAREDRDGYVVLEENEPPMFKVGDVVLSFGGLFQNHIGSFAGSGSRRSSGRVIFEMLGRAKEFEVSLYDLA